MRLLLRLLSSGCLFCLLACGAGEKEAVSEQVQLSEFPVLVEEVVPYHPLRDSLDLLVEEYENLQLWEAMARARRLNGWVEGREGVPGALKAELWQYLGMLHFAHLAYVDSVEIYTYKAQALVDTPVPTELKARQWLCRAYTGYEEMSWIEMAMFAQYGRSLLERTTNHELLLYAQLLTIEGRALKQMGYRTRQIDRRNLLLEKASSVMRRGIDTLGLEDSPWEAYAREQYVGVRIRQGLSEQDFLAQIDTINDLVIKDNTFAFTDRLMAYWHLNNGRLDSSMQHYERIAKSDQLFAVRRISDALYHLSNYNLTQNALDQAFDWTFTAMDHHDCCSIEGRQLRAEASAIPTECLKQLRCIYLWNSVSEIYNARYKTNSDNADREAALNLGREALLTFERTFLKKGDESVLNKNAQLGRQIIQNVLGMSVSLATDSFDATYHNMVLQAMELSKSMILTSELTDAYEGTHPFSKLDNFKQLRSEIKLLKASFTGTMHLPMQTLRRFIKLDRDAERLEAVMSTSTGHKEREHFSRIPTIQEVRKDLNDREVFIEFTETSTSIIGLGIDQDTSIVFSISKEATINAVSKFKIAFHDGGKTFQASTFGDISHKLYKLLFSSLSQVINRNNSILIVPTPTISSLPLAALVMEVPDRNLGFSDLDYLITDHHFRHLDSWRSERILARRRIKKFRDPSIGVWTHGDLLNYFGNLGENLIIRGSNDSRHFASQDIDPSRIVRQFGDFNVIHLSMHARGNDLRINNNFLYLSPTDSMNGVWLETPLTNTNLAVLAACSTATGYVGGMEGVYSIRRSLKIAGIPDIVFSLYDVSAAPTAKVLGTFYEHLLSGIATHDALARAQRHILKDNLQNRYVHPVNWAGLMCG